MIKTKTIERIKEYDPATGEVLRKIKTKTVTTNDADYSKFNTDYDSEELPFEDVR